MILYHNGEESPFFREKVNPNDREPFWVSWGWKLGSDAFITNSEWVVPAGFSVVDEFRGAIVANDCDEFTFSNGVVFSTTLTDGQHEIFNKVTYSYKSETFTLTRGFRIELGFI
jgi:hypothetical protein